MFLYIILIDVFYILNVTMLLGLIENAFKEFETDQLLNTKLIYQYCPQLNNYRSILQCQGSHKKIKFLSPAHSSPSRKGNQQRLIEVSIKY